MTYGQKTKKIIPTTMTYGQNWKLAGGGVDAESQHYSETLSVEVPVFIDDLEINAVKEAYTDKIKADLHSKIRTGKSDSGENKRHILQLLEALNEKFNR